MPSVQQKEEASLNPIPFIGEDVPYFELLARETAQEQDWDVDDEGQLAVDVIETPHESIIRSAIAGVEPEHLLIHVNHDTVTIRGRRTGCEEYPFADVHVAECHWGSFSRTIILPHHVRIEDVVATLKHGILTITLPKTRSESDVPVFPLS